MGVFQVLQNMGGDWKGQKVLHDPVSGTDKVSPLRATLVAQPSMELRYTWEYDGTPVEGLLTMANGPEGLRGTWVDGWHMADQPMVLVGTESDAGLVLRGQFAVEGQSSWGWTIVLTPAEPGRLEVVMAGVTPDNTEFPAAELSLRRA